METPMKKASAALTLGLLACTAMPVQAQSTNVRMYGVLDGFVEAANTGQGTVYRLGSGGIFSTRIGFTGVEDLGGGMKALFVLESQFALDTGTLINGGRLFGRTATVGLEKNGFGKIELGRMSTQINDSLSTLYMARYGAGNFLYNPNSTMIHDNTLKYTSPAWGPIVVAARYDFGETAGSGTRNSGRSIMATYRQGAAVALAGYTQSFGPLDISTVGDKLKVFTVGGAYDFGAIRPLVLVQSLKSENAPHTVDQRMINVGLEVRAGAGGFRFEYETLKNNALADADGKALSVRYDYPLSKRTTIYTGAAKVRSERNVYYPIVGASGSSPVAFPIAASYNGLDPSSVIVGIAHMF
jgi:GBP family porin